MRRIDYYASHEAAAIIDRLRTPRAGGDASSIVNQIIHEWATGCGVPELNTGKSLLQTPARPAVEQPGERSRPGSGNLSLPLLACRDLLVLTAADIAV
jgi:hypothetical protein